MTDEILVNTTLDEVRIAFLSKGIVREIHVERQNRLAITGNIYCGKVRRLLPGLKAAFVDMGLGRPGFLHAKDMDVDNQAFPEAQHTCSLTHLHLGDRLPVQVSKDPLGTKGPRLTTCFTLPGRLMVLTPGSFRMAVSQKITDAAESQRLLSQIQAGRFGGYIIRTSAKQASAEALLAEQHLLDGMWQKVLDRMTLSKPGVCLHQEPHLACRVLRDLTGNTEDIRIRVDAYSTLLEMKEYAAMWCPALVDRIEFYDEPSPIFDQQGSEKALRQALQRKVPLKSGGYLVFDQTEAMTTIDVNTGSTLSVRRAGDVIFRTNQEAVQVIAHQVRLRNLGGIIIIDFIDMADTHLQEVLLASLVSAFSEDTAHTEFSELTRLGLVQMTRKRARESLLHTLCDPCPQCQQRGMIRSAATVAHDIIRALRAMSDKSWSGFRVQLASEVAGFLLEHAPEAQSQLESYLGRTVELYADSRYGRESWDILPLADTSLMDR